MNEDSLYNDDEKYHDKQASEVSIVDQEKSWAELQQQLYSEEAEQIADSMWRQLRCKTTTLTYSVTWVKCIYIMVAVICIPIGVITYNLSQSVVMQEFAAYDSLAACSLQEFTANESWGKECKINYTIDYDFDPPIYFHYKLTNFYQNHRSYVKSRSEDQLSNEDVTDIDQCDPNQVKTSQAEDENKGLKMLPCGLIANSFFNDKYKVTYYEPGGGENGETLVIPFCNSTQCEMDEKEALWSDATWYASPNWEIKDIAYKSDVNGKFESAVQIDGVTTDTNQLQQWQNITLPDTDDRDFIVWMRTATIDTFTKLHRIINGQSLKKGAILEVTIKNYFEVSAFQGTKSIVITTNSSLGGKNDVLGIAFMVIGSISLLTAVCFRLLIPPKRSSPLHDV